MRVELLYLYVGENNTPVKNIDICFSHKYAIKYEDKTLYIDKKEEYQNKDFYGKYVKKCSLIVGKNGSGKTTLLNFLGLMSKNLNKYYNLRDKEKKQIFNASKAKFNCNDLGCWFALYTINESFYIEGYNFQRLFGQTHLNNLRISLDFSLFIKYDFSKKSLSPISFANSNKIPHVDFYYYKRLLNSNNTEFEFQENYAVSNIDNERNSTLRLFRKEITNANISNIYNLFGKYSELLFEKDFGKKAKIIIENKELDYVSAEKFDKNIISLFNRDTKTKFNYYNSDESSNSKDTFVSSLYYSLAFGLWNIYRSEININNLLPMNIISSNESKIIIEREIALYYQKEIQEKFNEDFHDYVKDIDEFTKCLKNVDEKYFIHGQKIEIPLTQHNTSIQKVLDHFYRKSEENALDQIINIKYKNLSNGEHEYIEVFGSLIKMLSEIESDNECKDRVLIFDEPDRTFHPEWTSNYISNLIKILNNFGEKKDIYFQIIISTHSPFMVSDVLKEDIYKIEINNESRKILNSEYGFASNYYDIMKDTFFLTSSVGHFAQEKIHSITIQIEEAKTISELIENKKTIEAIGDEYLRKILIHKYCNKLEMLNEHEKNMQTKEQIKEQIYRKEKELRDLKELLEKNE